MQRSFALIAVVLSLVGCSTQQSSEFLEPLPAPKTASTIQIGNANLSIEGIVVEIKPDEIKILSSENNKISLQMTGQSITWDGIAWVADIPVEVGDDAIASGAWGSNHSVFIVQNLYINIIFLRGLVGDVDKNNLEFELNDPRQGKNPVLINALAEVYLTDPNKQDSYQNIQVLPKSGDYVEVIGRKLKDGTILAVNMMIP